MNKDKKQIETLLNAYFEGKTSLKEEAALRHYFQQADVPESLKMYQPMFQFFTKEIKENSTDEKGQDEVLSQKENKHHKPIRVQLIRWISIAAAACFLLVGGIKFFNEQHRLPMRSQAYIDGKKYTDIELIQIEALNALQNLSEENEDIFSSQIDLLDSFLE